MSRIQSVQDIANAVDTEALISRPLSDWRPILSQECQVYVFGENYIAKRFDAINFKFCEKQEAKEILIDNISEEKGRRTMIWKTMTCYIC